MRITGRDNQVLRSFARYGILNRRLVQQLHFSDDESGTRVSRRRLTALVEGGFLRKHPVAVASTNDEFPAPVFTLAPGGCQYLANKFGGEYSRLRPIRIPNPSHLFHAVAVARLHVTLDLAAAQQDDIEILEWRNEYDDGIDKDQRDPRRLYTVMSSCRKIVCAPDAGFVLSQKDKTSLFYVEVERRATTSSRQILFRKAPGYAELARRKLYRKHFPKAVVDRFTVLLIAPSAQKRTTILQTFERLAPATYRSDLWAFTSAADVASESILESPIFFRCDDPHPYALIDL
jgi:hypothetical protein